MGLFDGFFWQGEDDTVAERIVTPTVSVRVGDVRSVQIMGRESVGELGIPQRLQVVLSEGQNSMLVGGEARSCLAQLADQDPRYERMVARWDLGLDAHKEDRQP
jgi:hypothetical protein